MALNKLKIDLNKQDEGTWFTFGGMRFLVKASDEAFNNRLQKALGNNKSSIVDNLRAYNKLVWTNLVLDWQDVTTTKLQSYVVSDEFNSEDAWHEIEGMKFHLKRVTSDLANSITKGTPHAKARKFINACLIDWDGVKFDDESEDIPYSKQQALDIFSDAVYADALKELVNAASDNGKYVVDIKDKEIKFSTDNVIKYMVDVDDNVITSLIATYANENENYREEAIKEDIETAKK